MRYEVLLCSNSEFFTFTNNSLPLLTLCQGGGVGCEGVSKDVDEFLFLIHGGGRNDSESSTLLLTTETRSLVRKGPKQNKLIFLARLLLLLLLLPSAVRAVPFSLVACPFSLLPST